METPWAVIDRPYSGKASEIDGCVERLNLHPAAATPPLRGGEWPPFYTYLEVDSGVECHQTLLVSDHGSDAAESRTVDIDVWVAPLRLVEDVDHIHPKREGFAFRDSNGLGQRAIKAEHSRASDRGRIA